MIVIHGENTIKSRNKLMAIIDDAKDKNTLVERFEADNLDRPTLESKLQKTDLFGHSRMVVIEGLHSLRRSKRKKELIKLVSSNQTTPVCLWEKRKLTKTMLKKLDAEQVFHFKLTNALFNWLDTLSPQTKTKGNQINALRKALKSDDEYLCFIMLARQIRLLIQAKTGGKVKGPYFVVNKIKKQAKRFKPRQLLKLHSQLHQLDANIKTSNNIVGLDQALELLILNL
jgi:DNA polymerase III delta subunit